LTEAVMMGLLDGGLGFRPGREVRAKRGPDP